MRGILFLSLGGVLRLILLTGFIAGVVWFTGTPFADTLRSVGAPIPYCTTHSLAALCEMDYVSPSTSAVSDTNMLSVFMLSRPSDEFINAFCSVSNEGANVRMVLSEYLRGDTVLMDTLDRCKIKYRFSGEISTNELITDSCYLSFTGYRGVYTCCSTVIDKFSTYFEEVWAVASP